MDMEASQTSRRSPFLRKLEKPRPTSLLMMDTDGPDDVIRQIDRAPRISLLDQPCPNSMAMDGDGPCDVFQTPRSSPLQLDSSNLLTMDSEVAYDAPRQSLRTSPMEQLQPTKMYSRRRKRRKLTDEGNEASSISSVMGSYFESKYKSRKRLSDVLDYRDPFSVPSLMVELREGVYGSATKDIEDLCAWTRRMLTPVFAMHPGASRCSLDFSPESPKRDLDAYLPNVQRTKVSQLPDNGSSHLSSQDIVDLDGDCTSTDPPVVNESKSDFISTAEKIQKSGYQSFEHITGNHGTVGQMKTLTVQNDIEYDSNKDVIIINSDEEDDREKIETLHSAPCNHGASNFKHGGENKENNKPVPSFSPEEIRLASYQYQEKFLKKSCGERPINSFSEKSSWEVKGATEERSVIAETERRKEKCVYAGDEDDLMSIEDDVQSLYIIALEAGKPLIPQTSTLHHKLHYNHQRRENEETSKAVLCSARKTTQHASTKQEAAVLEKPIKDVARKNGEESKVVEEEEKNIIAETQTRKGKGVYVGVQEELASTKSNLQNDLEDGLADMWREMMMASEFSKDAAKEITTRAADKTEECDHSFVLKDDLGRVCRVCGVVQKSIETIFDFQWGKGSKNRRTYMYESRNLKDRERNDGTCGSRYSSSQQDLAVADIAIHPRHMNQMKSHQLEGFNFLVRNLMADDPGGCILAHAPGSGKTFIVVSFIQSFLAKHPNARPLIILPKGILATSKREFQRWQVEDLPLYDFYTSKAEKRSDQLDVLNQWVKHKGILFLGYQQFSNIVCSTITKTDAACKEILIKVPTILIMDEGHTPRNENTNVLSSLAEVHTPRKVVLSGTLFQNHVKEVFNILNLVRPKFLHLDGSKSIQRRIMSRVQISGGRQFKASGADATFYEMVEETLKHDEDYKRKVTLIQDLREMTGNVLHYYKGELLDELPGLTDFTVFLNLSRKQKYAVDQLKTLEMFKRISLGTAVYLHPHLKEFSETSISGDRGCNFDEDKMDNLLNKMDIRDGVKAKFFLSILGLCESSGEKLLVFSQYLLPLKFLERLVVKTKSWSPGKEMFMISGDSNTEQREWSMECFNNSPDAKLFFGSIKACGEGISLVGASRVIILDVHLNPSVTRQAIGRAFRPGQLRKVYIYRLVAADSPEEENHHTCLRKELISKMWFEWSEYCSHKDFQMETIDPKDTDDMFWESPSLVEDVKVLYKRTL